MKNHQKKKKIGEEENKRWKGVIDDFDNGFCVTNNKSFSKFLRIK